MVPHSENAPLDSLWANEEANSNFVTVVHIQTSAKPHQEIRYGFQNRTYCQTPRMSRVFALDGSNFKGRIDPPDKGTHQSCAFHRVSFQQKMRAVEYMPLHPRERLHPTQSLSKFKKDIVPSP